MYNIFLYENVKRPSYFMLISRRTHLGEGAKQFTLQYIREGKLGQNVKYDEGTFGGTC